MKRRVFIKTGLGAGLAAGAVAFTGGIDRLFAQPAGTGRLPYDLVAVKGGEPDVMFVKAIESLGGMGAFVKKGQSVVVKPNIGWDVPPERAGNTNPLLVKQIIKQCLAAGASVVYVFDNTCDKWDQCYETSGIKQAVSDAGGKMVPGNQESYYQQVEIPGGVKLKSTKVHELILQSDVFINVPVIKHHSSASMTIAMKNLMGVVWDRMYWHRNDLQQCIADYASFRRKPDLNVVDAYRIMLRNGPRGVSPADVSLQKQLLVSTDMVTIDAAAAKIFGKEPADIKHIVLAEQLGVGRSDLNGLRINRIIL
ncbi:MAG TPA: DUF362 domain-containing protein [Bacteroidales bacterium]|nr:DUF362 domain-containing protein [Bacteroidales bacterium]